MFTMYSLLHIYQLEDLLYLQVVEAYTVRRLCLQCFEASLWISMIGIISCHFCLIEGSTTQAWPYDDIQSHNVTISFKSFR